MDEKQLQYFRHKLEGLRRGQEELARRLNEGLRMPLTDSVGELSSYDNHPADLGDATFEREKDLGLKILTEEQLSRIDEALGAIKTGDYGKCRSCGAAISPERLETIPYAAFCRSCQEDLEEREDTSYLYRPVEEEVVKMPLDSIGEDNKNDNAFDGEDAWQDVAEYGTSSNWPPDEENGDNKQNEA
ncbi:MAG: TraR/DksA C4-type zinc finger protein [Clostridia bacterium]|jgi:YteA family regulatory protein|nr:TraR/DksA C4-type zinc finger protein [Clostridia bacterium]